MDDNNRDLLAKLEARVQEFEASVPKESSERLARHVKQKIRSFEKQARGVETQLVILMASKVITEDEAVMLFHESCLFEPEIDTDAPGMDI